MRNLIAFLVCLVCTSVYFRWQTPTAMPQPALSETSDPLPDPPHPPVWGKWKSYTAPDGSCQVSLPSKPEWSTHHLADEKFDFMRQGICYRDGENIKVGWIRRYHSVEEAAGHDFLSRRRFILNGLPAAEFRIDAPEHWAPGDGPHNQGPLFHKRMIIADAHPRYFFVKLACDDFEDLKNDFPKLRNSFRIKDTR